MKVWKKLTVFFMAALTLFAGICGGITLSMTWNASVRTITDSYLRQIDAVSYTFGQFMMRRDFEEMGDTVRDAYLRFEFGKCCGSGYLLRRGDDVIANLTDYDLKRVSAMEGSSALQKLGAKQLLIVKKTLGGTGGYEIYGVHDITGAYDDLRRQLFLHLAVYLVMMVFVTVITLAYVRRILGPLHELKRTAQKLSGGSLGERALVRTDDEIGELGLAFNQMADRIEQQVADLKLLLGALNHEIKTPMTSIIGYSDSLLHSKLTEAQKQKALEYILQEGKRLERLSGKMMGMLGMYENDAVEMEWIPVQELFLGVIETEERYLDDHQTRWSIRCGQGLEVYGDQALLESLLINLIQNGVRASRPGGSILLTGDRTGIYVSDQGCGIPEEELAHITKAFYMVDKSRSRKEGGAGLGLAICQQIAKLHGGRLAIQSKVGEGTRAGLEFRPDAVRQVT